MTKKQLIELADTIRTYNNFAEEPFTARQIAELASFCKRSNPAFKLERWLDYIAGKCGPNGGRVYQPKTGERCHCRPGMERDNCPDCEGTSWKIDFKKIREAR